MEHQHGTPQGRPPHDWMADGRWWSGEHRAALHRFMTMALARRPAGGAPPAGRAGSRDVAAGDPSPAPLPAPLFPAIRHADGRPFHDGEPLTLADAQVLLNDAIAEGRIEVGSFLRVEPDRLIIEPPGADPGA